MRKRMKILFLCTGNACRSQMAEGWARHLKSKELEVHSAGVIAHGLNEFAVQVMREAGVDISGQKSKTVNDLPTKNFDYVITLCDKAAQRCPYFPGKTATIHAPFDDPPALSMNARSEEEALGHYRRVRDEIRRFVESLPGALPGRK